MPKTMKNLSYAFKAIESPFYIIFNIICTCINDLKEAVLTVIFINVFLKMVENKAPIMEIMKLLGIYAVIFSLIILLSNYFDRYYKPSRLPKIQGKLMLKLFHHSTQSDMENYDDPNFYNDYVWCMTNIDQTVISMIDDIAKLISNLVIAICISVLFITINIFIMVAVLISVGATVFIYSFIIKINFAKDLAATPYQRKADYFKRVFYLKDYSKELRITKISKLLREQFDSNENDLFRILRQFGKKLMLANTANGLTISTLLDIGLRILLVYQLMVAKSITLGEFAASSFGLWSLFFSLNGLMYGFNRLPEHSLRIQKMKAFMEKRPRVYTHGHEPIQPENSAAIRLSNVSFSYSYNAPCVLNDINLTIRQGEKIAIVGENGSGKSTLVKILLGLYEPTAGEIFFNNQNLKDIAIDEYRQSFNIVFQDFSFFAVSIAQNIALDINYDDIQIEHALRKSLFYSDDYLKTIPLDAVMTKEFDENGLVLSGGQAQKLIIARAFMDKTFTIMDEPSSSLDVVSETRLNNAVLHDTDNKAVIVISHRLSTAKRADRIIVMSQGKIVEQGTHDELMRIKGRYEKMFTIQAEQYVQG